MVLHLWGWNRTARKSLRLLRLIHLGSGDLPVLIDVFMPSVRERMSTRFVKKTLSLPAWLAALADENNVNFSKVFQNALMEQLHVRR